MENVSWDKQKCLNQAAKVKAKFKSKFMESPKLHLMIYKFFVKDFRYPWIIHRYYNFFSPIMLILAILIKMGF